jgi:hypothetical protein
MLWAAGWGFVLIQPRDCNAHRGYREYTTYRFGRLTGFDTAAGFSAGLSRGDTDCCVLPLGLRRRRGLQTWLMLMVAAGGLGLLSACATVTTSNSNQTPGAPTTPGPTTSMVTVTATSGSIQQSATISLTVN